VPHTRSLLASGFRPVTFGEGSTQNLRPLTASPGAPQAVARYSAMSPSPFDPAVSPDPAGSFGYRALPLVRVGGGAKQGEPLAGGYSARGPDR
jgi:hypothetical protein